jgi:drug/metabolite transporter (DMT)-like permease
VEDITASDERGQPLTSHRAWLLLGGVILVWGLHWSIIKIGLERMPPMTYAMLRVLLGAIVLALLMRRRGRLALPDRRDLPVVLSYGLLAIGAATALMTLALMTAPAGRSSILMYTLPLWVVPLMAWLTASMPTRRELAGLALGLGGLVLLLNPVAMDWSAPGALAASAMLLIGAMVSAVALVHVRLHPWQGTPFDVQLWQLLVALVPLTVLAFLSEAPMSVSWDLRTVIMLLYSGVLATAFAYWANQSATIAVGPVVTSITYLGVPVVGVLGGALILGEAIPLTDLLGMVVIGAGISLVALARRTEPIAAMPRSDRPAEVRGQGS